MTPIIKYTAACLIVTCVFELGFFLFSPRASWAINMLHQTLFEGKGFTFVEKKLPVGGGSWWYSNSSDSGKQSSTRFCPGDEVMCQHSVAFLITVKNAIRYLPRTLKNVEAVGQKTKNWSLFVYSGDKEDDSYIREFSKKWTDKVFLLKRALYRGPLKRLLRLAWARNQLLEYLVTFSLEKLEQSWDFFVVVDADMCAEWTHELAGGSVFEYAMRVMDTKPKLAGVFANGIDQETGFYIDRLSWGDSTWIQPHWPHGKYMPYVHPQLCPEDPEWPIASEGARKYAEEHEKELYTKFDGCEVYELPGHKNSTAVKVDSAFGGFAIYRGTDFVKAIKKEGCRYDATSKEGTGLQCEHVGLHLCIKEKLHKEFRILGTFLNDWDKDKC